MPRFCLSSGGVEGREETRKRRGNMLPFRGSHSHTHTHTHTHIGRETGFLFDVSTSIPVSYIEIIANGACATLEQGTVAYLSTSSQT